MGFHESVILGTEEDSVLPSVGGSYCLGQVALILF